MFIGNLFYPNKTVELYNKYPKVHPTSMFVRNINQVVMLKMAFVPRPSLLKMKFIIQNSLEIPLSEYSLFVMVFS